ncbi:Tetratricopeptide-like helical [Penicillium expansum]|nr:Tetratricopeptide-like helical [Penicillium expansum]
MCFTLRHYTMLLQTCAAGPGQPLTDQTASGAIDHDADHEFTFQTGEAEPRPITQRVENAWNTLRTIKKPVLQSDKSRGLLGTAVHYGRQTVRLLFLNGPSTEKPERKLNKHLAGAVEDLRAAADEDRDPDAMFLLAEMNFYGNFSHPRDFKEAFRWYHDLAWLDGNNTAQNMVGFMYATGIGGAVEPDQAKALMYHEFAAEAGNIRSEMTLAYRYHTGIGTPKDCDHAIHYYKKVADKAIEYYRSGPPGGRALVRESYRWADEEGGVYGPGASVSSSGQNARDAANATPEASVEDILEYLDLMSRKGELKATYTLGRRTYWSDVPSREGVEQHYPTALTWFRRGIANGDSLCQHWIGLMYLKGYGVPQDGFKASHYFKAAAEQDSPASESRLGALFLDQGDVATATRYFELAARWGWMEAYYYLAEMANFGIGRQRHCGVAAAYYKMVAEKAEIVHSAFVEANAAYESGDKESALIPSMMAAEQGYENAQANVAYLLDEHRSVLSLSSILPWAEKARSSLMRNARLALIYWTRSSKQANIDSLVKMGDYYLSGTGTPVDANKASTCYHNAAEAHHSAQGYWNLGWMHENGVAVDQDFHMAKRYYDLALDLSPEAYLPVKLSLIKLRIRGYWNRITNGNINPIHEEEDSKPRRTFKEWVKAFIENDEEGYYEDLYEQQRGDDDEYRGLESEGHEDGYYDDLDLDIDEECSKASSLSDWLLRCWFWFISVNSNNNAIDRIRTPMPMPMLIPRMEMGTPTTVDFSLSLVTLISGNGWQEELVIEERLVYAFQRDHFL